MPSVVERARALARVAAMTGVTLGMLGGVRVRQRTLPRAERYQTYQRWMKRWALARWVFDRLSQAAARGELGKASNLERLKVTLHESHVARGWYEAELRVG